MFSVSALVRLYRYPIIGHLAQRMVLRRGADIPRSVKIGHRVSFPHNALGTVLHPDTTLEDYVKVYQNRGLCRRLRPRRSGRTWTTSLLELAYTAALIPAPAALYTPLPKLDG